LACAVFAAATYLATSQQDESASTGSSTRVHRLTAGDRWTLLRQPFADARELWALYRARGVTHLVWRGEASDGGTLQWATLTAELIAACSSERIVFGTFELAELCADAPPPSSPVRVLVRGHGLYEDGLYYAEDLRRRDSRADEIVSPRTEVDFGNTEQVEVALERSDVVVLGDDAELDRGSTAAFRKFGKIEAAEVLLRHTGAHP
jgi:hypothetical protein